jgi:hypothetical protein
MQEPRRRELFKMIGVAAIAGFAVQAQDTSNSSNKAKEFAPGEKIPASGIYNVIHDKVDGDDHAQQHRITLIAGGAFPRCKGCGEWVRFRLYQAAENAETAPHFAS